ncbi:MAG: hypothetical protein K2X27_26805 [Candidatus Obscuribacterales bacterium]|nr:hypothetical protein [Candidatus Obscuribacterales bacterium]
MLKKLLTLFLSGAGLLSIFLFCQGCGCGGCACGTANDPNILNPPRGPSAPGKPALPNPRRRNRKC